MLFFRLTFFLILLGCSSVTPNLPALKIQTTLVDDFLLNVCGQSSDEKFLSSWDEHEKKYWDLYSVIYYQTEQKKQERGALLSKMRGRQKEMCKNARIFRAIVESVVHKAAQDAFTLSGYPPSNSNLFDRSSPVDRWKWGHR